MGWPQHILGNDQPFFLGRKVTGEVQVPFCGGSAGVEKAEVPSDSLNLAERLLN